MGLIEKFYNRWIDKKLFFLEVGSMWVVLFGFGGRELGIGDWFLDYYFYNIFFKILIF